MKILDVLLVSGKVIGTIVLILVVLIGVLYFFYERWALGAEKVTNAFIANIQSDNWPAAYSQMSDEYRANHTQSEFESMIQALPKQKITWLHMKPRSSGTLTIGGKTMTIVVYLDKKNGIEEILLPQDNLSWRPE